MSAKISLGASARLNRQTITRPTLDACVKVTDPVCGMSIEDSRAVARGTYGSETVYFCSTACKAAYDRQHTATKG